MSDRYYQPIRSGHPKLQNRIIKCACGRVVREERIVGATATVIEHRGDICAVCQMRHSETLERAFRVNV